MLFVSSDEKTSSQSERVEFLEVPLSLFAQEEQSHGAGTGMGSDNGTDVCNVSKAHAVFSPTSNAEEAKVERFYEDLQDLLPESCAGQT